jgi:hypothetical protein
LTLFPLYDSVRIYIIEGLVALLRWPPPGQGLDPEEMAMFDDDDLWEVFVLDEETQEPEPDCGDFWGVLDDEGAVE